MSFWKAQAIVKSKFPRKLALPSERLSSLQVEKLWMERLYSLTSV
jgi:hypothetical protein